MVHGLKATTTQVHPGSASLIVYAPPPLPAYATVPITFHAEDCNEPFYPHEDAFMISANVNGVELCNVDILNYFRLLY